MIHLSMDAMEYSTYGSREQPYRRLPTPEQKTLHTRCTKALRKRYHPAFVKRSPTKPGKKEKKKRGYANRLLYGHPLWDHRWWWWDVRLSLRHGRMEGGEDASGFVWMTTLNVSPRSISGGEGKSWWGGGTLR